MGKKRIALRSVEKHQRIKHDADKKAQRERDAAVRADRERARRMVHRGPTLRGDRFF